MQLESSSGMSRFVSFPNSHCQAIVRRSENEGVKKQDHRLSCCKLVASFCRWCSMQSHVTSLLLTCGVVHSGKPRMPVRNHGNMEGRGCVIFQITIGCIHMDGMHTHKAPLLTLRLTLNTLSHTQFQRELIHNVAWQRKFSADSFMEWESSLPLLPGCHFLSNRSLVSAVVLSHAANSTNFLSHS